MSVNFLVVSVIIIALGLGFASGFVSYIIYSRKLMKKHLQGAIDVLSGKKENKITLDGEEFEARKFVLKDKNGENVKLDLFEMLKGGETIQNAEEKSCKEESPRQEERISGSPTEDCHSPGKKERTSRGRISRIRRFG